MARSHKRAAKPAASSAREAVESSSSSSSQETASNDFVTQLMAEALLQADVDSETMLSIAGQDTSDQDLGKYHWAEDGDDVEVDTGPERRTQDLDLPELREKHADKKYEDYENGKAFLQGEGDEHAVDPNDVRQGALGDCYLMAGMIAVARANPQAIADLIQDNGDGTFDVTLYIRESRYGRPQPTTVTIDAQLPSKYTGKPLYAGIGDKVDGDTELWTALIEKAVAQQKGSYELISGGNISKGFEFHGAQELLTGRAEGYMRTSSMDEDDALLHIAIALDDKTPVTCDSYNLGDDEQLTAEANKKNVYWNHAYAPMSVDLDGRTIDLQNPWGSHHVESLRVSDFLKYYRSIRIGA